MVRKLFVEKKKGISSEAENLKKDIFESLGIGLDDIRILNRYDVENISDELFKKAITTVFSEPPVDDVYQNVPHSDSAFQISYLPGQFDQRAKSAEECLSFISPETKAKVKSSRVYLLYGKLEKEEIERIETYLINPVEAFLDTLDDIETLAEDYEESEDVRILDGFIEISMHLRQRDPRMGTSSDFSAIVYIPVVRLVGTFHSYQGISLLEIFGSLDRQIYLLVVIILVIRIHRHGKLDTCLDERVESRRSGRISATDPSRPEILHALDSLLKGLAPVVDRGIDSYAAEKLVGRDCRVHILRRQYVVIIRDTAVTCKHRRYSQYQ